MEEYLRAALADPRMLRLLIWNGLTDEHDSEEHQARAGDDLADMRRRQEAGEIAADIDPGLYLLVFMGALAAPVAMPQVVRRLTGLDSRSPEFSPALRAGVSHTERSSDSAATRSLTLSGYPLGAGARTIAQHDKMAMRAF